MATKAMHFKFATVLFLYGPYGKTNFYYCHKFGTVVLSIIKPVITGGAGFIGSHLVDRLLERGHAVSVIDDFSSGKREKSSHHKDNPRLKVFTKRICDDDLDALFVDVSVVFHVAARPRVQFSIKNPKKQTK